MTQEETENLTNSIISKMTELVLKSFPQRNQVQKASLVNSIKCLKKKSYQFWRGQKNTSQLILWGLYPPDTKVRQRYHKKTTEKYPSWIYTQKSYQNISKMNSETFKKDYLPWLTGIYPCNARLVYQLKINEYSIPYK